MGKVLAPPQRPSYDGTFNSISKMSVFLKCLFSQIIEIKTNKNKIMIFKLKDPTRINLGPTYFYT